MVVLQCTFGVRRPSIVSSSGHRYPPLKYVMTICREWLVSLMDKDTVSAPRGRRRLPVVRK
jgi:hypothetical protein